MFVSVNLHTYYFKITTTTTTTTAAAAAAELKIYKWHGIE
jgi:hypothetical protein